MAKKDFNTFYKTQYSTQGTLANMIIPQHIDRLLYSVEMTEFGDQQGVLLLFSMLSSLCPPFSKTFKNYEERFNAKLIKCRKMRDDWLRNDKRRHWPGELVESLLGLYREWWGDFNDSGAGFGLEAIDPSRKAKLRKIITGENPR